MYEQVYVDLLEDRADRLGVLAALDWQAHHRDISGNGAVAAAG
jgi:hypothetical protein